MKSKWLVQYEHVLSNSVYVKDFLTYVYTHMNVWMKKVYENVVKVSLLKGFRKCTLN